jgi:hypothetical protein
VGNDNVQTFPHHALIFFPKPTEQFFMSKIIRALDAIISSFILLTIGVMIFFAIVHSGYVVLDLWKHVHDQELPLELMYLVTSSLVFVKAYRILAAYLISHHVQIKLLVKIAIIASTMDVIFNMQHNDIWQNIIMAVFSLAILLIYSIFGGKLDEYEE